MIHEDRGRVLYGYNLNIGERHALWNLTIYYWHELYVHENCIIIF